MVFCKAHQILSTYKNFDSFLKNYQVSDEELEILKEEAEKRSVKPKDEEERNKTLPQLKLQLKALLARDLWDMSEYFEVMNQENEAVQKAVELLEKK